MDTVFPTELRDTNNDVTHYIHKGFRGIEYQAVRVFFPKFGIKVPDTPLLSPEFSNPLFLKLFYHRCMMLSIQRKQKAL